MILWGCPWRIFQKYGPPPDPPVVFRRPASGNEIFAPTAGGFGGGGGGGAVLRDALEPPEAMPGDRLPETAMIPPGLVR